MRDPETNQASFRMSSGLENWLQRQKRVVLWASLSPCRPHGYLRCKLSPRCSFPSEPSSPGPRPLVLPNDWRSGNLYRSGHHDIGTSASRGTADKHLAFYGKTRQMGKNSISELALRQQLAQSSVM